MLYPVFKGTYHRPAPQTPQLGPQQFQDLGRSVDYLETRTDIDHERIAYAGLSWGAGMGFYLSSSRSTRFKTLILISGGLSSSELPPEAQQVSYASRITIPVLMFNGRYDQVVPLETNVEPVFEILGTPQRAQEARPPRRRALAPSDPDQGLPGLARSLSRTGRGLAARQS